jgi:nucleoside-diphosphate-sugar epimerase
MKLSVLILGSEGQIGLGLQKVLKDKGSNYDCIDLKLGKDHDLRDKNNQQIREKIENADFVYFLAYDIGGSKYISEAESQFSFINNNILIMQNVFSILKEHQIKFIFASSQMSNMDFSTYGILKLIGEKYTQSLKGRYVKFWNVFGIETDHHRAHVITDFLSMASKSGEINMLTNGNETRDFLFSEDAARALECVRENYEKFDENDSVDIASFQTYSIFQIAEVISTLYALDNKKIRIVKGNKIDLVQKGKSNIPKSDILKYWKPMFNLIDGIKILKSENE